MSSQERYRTAIQMDGMIKDLIRNLSSNNDELQMHCANAIFKVPVFHTFEIQQFNSLPCYKCNL